MAAMFVGALLVVSAVTCRPPTGRVPTITVLPDLPKVPASGIGLSAAQKTEVIQTLVNHKLSTYPVTSSRGHRVGKFTSTGIFGGFPPTEEQIARIAPHYDNILFGAARSELIPRFKKYNPDLTFFLYVDSGLNPGFVQSDAGGVDAENLDWVLAHHPDWILKDKDGNFIRSGNSRFANKGAYWPDPGNPGWQDYFADKVMKLIRETGGQWNGVLLDQFIGTADGYERYAGAHKQVKYADDEGLSGGTDPVSSSRCRQDSPAHHREHGGRQHHPEARIRRRGGESCRWSRERDLPRRDADRRLAALPRDGAESAANCPHPHQFQSLAAWPGISTKRYSRTTAIS